MNDQDLIGYDDIIETSMRLVICETLKKVEKKGLPGNHYFVITFVTNLYGTSISPALLERYPEEMTIVIQHQFKGLKVEADSFSISLSFGGKYEKLVIPYKAITSFADPSMNFSLKFSIAFNGAQDEQESDNVSNQVKKGANQGGEENNLDLSAKVVSLDAFRKNKDNKNT